LLANIITAAVITVQVSVKSWEMKKQGI